MVDAIIGLMTSPPPFHDSYLNYDQLTAQVKHWQRTYPDVVKLESLGKTPQGREMWLLTLGPQPDQIRPAVWIDGNMHATELCGSNVALAIAEDIIRLHADDQPPSGLPETITSRLREVLFYILPRISPDGAEAILESRGYVRSVPRNDTPQRGAYWRSCDIDGDGKALLMRVQDDTGEFTVCPEFPDLLVLRELGDAGPFYKVYPEGMIENFDGQQIPSPHYLGDNPVDLNRNFPWSWAPHHLEPGAGHYPGSEIESRSILEFTAARPHIFAWLNLHTFGGVGIRPLGDKRDVEMDPGDLAIYRQVGDWLETETGYPMVSGFEEFTYKPDTPVRGALSDYAYNQRGCLAYVIELWDIFSQAGVPTKKRFVDNYTHLTRDDMVSLACWDRDNNASRVVLPWSRFAHPQLGPVELGGLDPLIGISNPPPDRIAELCEQQSKAFLRVAAMAPAIVFDQVTTRQLDSQLHRVDIEIVNRGYLGSYGIQSAKQLDWNEELRLQISVQGGRLVDGITDVTLGHLDGWGRGRFDGTGALYFMRSRGSTGRAHYTCIVSGDTGGIRLSLSSPRTGRCTHVTTFGS